MRDDQCVVELADSGKTVRDDVHRFEHVPQDEDDDRNRPKTDRSVTSGPKVPQQREHQPHVRREAVQRLAAGELALERLGRIQHPAQVRQADSLGPVSDELRPDVLQNRLELIALRAFVPFLFGCHDHLPARSAAQAPRVPSQGLRETPRTSGRACIRMPCRLRPGCHSPEPKQRSSWMRYLTSRLAPRPAERDGERLRSSSASAATAARNRSKSRSRT